MEVLIDGNDAIDGGGIANVGDAELTLLRSTLAGNVAGRKQDDSAGGFGGGLFNASNASSQLVLSTLSRNQADFNGGGIASFGQLDLLADTIHENAAGQTTGGVYLGSGAASIVSTIISGNTTTDPSGILNLNDNAGSATLSGNHNLLGSGVTIFGTNNITSDQPELTPLDYYGGNTPTHALKPSSPAVHAGDDDLLNQLDETSDQRSLPFVRDDGAGVGHRRPMNCRPLMRPHSS